MFVRSRPASSSALLAVVWLLAGAPAARSASGDERWSGSVVRPQGISDELVASPSEPVSFVLNPRTRTITSFAATVLETVRCLPAGDTTLRDPRYADDAVETVRPRRLSVDGPVKLGGAGPGLRSFSLGRGAVGGEDGGEPGSWMFAANVAFDPVGNPGLENGRGFLGQALSGGAAIGPTESDAGRCRSFPDSLQWSVKGPALHRLRVRTTVARSRSFSPLLPSYLVTVRLTNWRGRPVPRGLVTVVQAPRLLNDNPRREARRTGRDGSAVMRVDGDRPVSVTAQANGLMARVCGLLVNRARPAATRLRCA